MSGILYCPYHGRVDVVETCQHVAEEIDQKKYGEFQYVGTILVCENCFHKYNLDRLQNLRRDFIGILNGEGSWEDMFFEALDDKTYEEIYERFEGRTGKCSDCIRVAIVEQARRNGKPSPFTTYEKTLISNHEETITELYNFLTQNFQFKESLWNHPQNKRNYNPLSQLSLSGSLYIILASAILISASLFIISFMVENDPWIFRGFALAIAVGTAIRIYNERKWINKDIWLKFGKGIPLCVDTDFAVFPEAGRYTRPFTVEIYYVTTESEQNQIVNLIKEFFKHQKLNQVKISFYETEIIKTWENPLKGIRGQYNGEEKLLKEIMLNC